MSEIRFDSLNFRGAIVAPERANRPIDVFKQEECPFCPGNEHLTPQELLKSEKLKNVASACVPGDWGVRVIPNKYPAVKCHEVVIDTPIHNIDSWTKLDDVEILEILKVLRDRANTMFEYPEVKFVQIFKNQGKYGGASVLHMHTQLMGLIHVPETIQRRIEINKNKIHESKCSFCKLITNDNKVSENEFFYTVINPIPRFAGECIVTSKNHNFSFQKATDAELLNLGLEIKTVHSKLENICDFHNYNYIFNISPKGESEFHFSFEIVPRLNSIGGYELATGFHINNFSPEDIARKMRAL